MTNIARTKCGLTRWEFDSVASIVTYRAVYAIERVLACRRLGIDLSSSYWIEESARVASLSLKLWRAAG